MRMFIFYIFVDMFSHAHTDVDIVRETGRR